MELTKGAQQNPDQAHITELRTVVHKIAGSAGTYGYALVSIVCKEMDVEMSKRIASGQFGEAKWLASLDEFVQKVKESFQTSSLKEFEPAGERFHISRPLLYVVDDDAHFLELLERIKDQFAIDLAVEFDPLKAKEKLMSADFNPHGIIVSRTFRASSATGFEIMDAQRHKSQHKPAPILALLLEQDSTDIRIEAMQKGINYIFRKPVSAYVLLKAMKDAFDIETLSHVKVLILDDDADFCNFVTAVLSEIGISVQSIYDSANLFNTLEEYKPNILLLDLVLPKYDGLNLLKTLRQDVAYNNLIVVIVTSSEESATRMNAYSANADDIFYKPFDKALLQKRILNLVERQIATNELTDPQDYTGLLHLKALTSELHTSLLKSDGTDKHLALFEVHAIKDWIKEKGYAAAKDLLIFISNQLYGEADFAMKCFSYNTSKFAIIFDALDLQAIESKMYAFLSGLAQSESKSHLSFNCSIVPISKNFGDAQQVLRAAEQALLEAREKKGLVKIVDVLPKGESLSKKEVVIVDSDSELLNILKQAFESHNLIVKTYVEGGDALKDLLERNEGLLPALIIVERKLADMDGMDLCIKLKARFRVPIPFYVLTVFSADRDISEGIKHDILEYIVKPFNISILVQKALKVIYKG